MFKFLILILSSLITINSYIFSENVNNQKISALFLVPIANDWVVTKPMILPGPINIKCQDEVMHKNALEFYDETKRWTLTFDAPYGKKIQVGNYPDAQRFPFQEKGQPGLTLMGWGSGYNQLKGEFEVFEIVYGDNNQVISFAADFLQENALGSIRYNSSYPVKEHFKNGTHPNMDWKKTNIVYLNKTGADESEALIAYNYSMETTVKFEKGLDISIYYGGISIEKCKINFFIPKVFDLKNEIDFGYRCSEDNFDFSVPSLRFTHVFGDSEIIPATIGYFLIKELKVDHLSNKVISFAADYYFYDHNKEEYGGVIRMNSNFPVEKNF